MQTIRSLCGVFVTAVVMVLGIETAQTVWQAGLNEKVDAKARKLFSKKKES